MLGVKVRSEIGDAKEKVSSETKKGGKSGRYNKSQTTYTTRFVGLWVVLRDYMYDWSRPGQADIYIRMTARLSEHAEIKYTYRFHMKMAII